MLSLVLTQGARLALAGVLLGLALAVAFSRGVSALLYEVRPTDSAVLGGVAAILFAAAMLASFVPAHRAAHIDPNAALREE